MHNRGRGYHNEFRIIAGEWRRRRLSFPPVPDIRPSPDRVRETLFNWLRDTVAGASCLDLFAGSGALGLEALSRGAAAVLFVDHERRVVEALNAHLARLGAAGGTSLQADALAYLRGTPHAFDLVFLDPPFASPFLGEVIAALRKSAWLAPTASIYMEYPKGAPPVVPDDWTLVRTSRAGQVGFALARRSGPRLA
ncbi:MAG: 16S rRNA (guanine(966)-N(2))-methyltransferase RsmD [Gammaproteobacteria bacterium]